MLNKFLLAALFSASTLCANSAMATDLSFTGNLTSPNEVLLFNFSVGATSNVTLRTFSYAGGTNSAGTAISRGGFDPILALFDSSGAKINQNDDGDSLVPADAVTGQNFDTFLESVLDPGNYTVSVQAFSNFAIGPNLSDGFTSGGSFTDVTGNLRDNHWAFDVLNVQSATQVTPAVPEPATWAMMLVGLGGIGFMARRRRNVPLQVKYY